MNNTSTAIKITSPLLFPCQEIFTEIPSEQKLKKDGTPKKTVCNKKKGKKSEVYPIEIEDMKSIINFFIENEMWQHYLLFVISCNMARRIGDSLNLQWKHFYNENGTMRKDLLEIVEDKTDKLANPHINSACRAAINLYIAKTKFNPADNNYNNYVFVQDKGNYKGKVITADGYRKGLKKAAKEIGITYNIGTHSPRKTFGMMSRMLHPNDYDSMELLQTIYNHSDTKTTKHYIGLTKQKIDEYYDDFGTFFDEYVTGDKTYSEMAEKPVVSIETNDLREIIMAAYKAGSDNASETDPAKHIAAVNEILKKVEGLIK